MARRLRAAVVGLGFGAEFIPIYQNHPDTEMYAICQRTRESLDRIGDAFGIAKRYTSFADLIADPDVDLVHINTPIPDHAPQSLAALRAGKHVACTVPMATTVEECLALCRAQRESGKVYTMMETAVFTREFLFVQEMQRQGKLGRIQFLRGAHQQEMAGWPGYWEGLPPMHYATHAVSPLLALAGKPAEKVYCLGSGRIAESLASKYGSPFAIETALFRLRGSDLACEVTRSLFETARQYVESFDVYGSRTSFEWQQTEAEEPVLFEGEEPRRVSVPDYAHLLPEGIRRYTTHGVYDAEENVHLSFKQGSGHGGSHPHLVHEFVRAILEERPPVVDAPTAANWTMAGICAHLSAMQDGAPVSIPDPGA